MRAITGAFRGDGLMARGLRSASFLTLGFGLSQIIRLGSNLILTRLLFPEAFGLMALITVVTVGLTMFSDVGTSPAIAQSKRGDDPDFLNTAWTIQVIRGFALWSFTAALAIPAAKFYNSPELALYLPLSGLTLILYGFEPTKVDTAQRHLIMGRLTLVDLLSQVIGVIILIILAWIMKSVLALVIGGLFSTVARLILANWMLPGIRNRFRWEPEAAAELIRFGKWVFLSTACSFISNQGDRAILGRFMSLDALGLYNIGYFLASFPLLLGHSIVFRLLIPVYRDLAGRVDSGVHRKLRRMRFALTAGLVLMLGAMAMLGPWIVGVLYDDRYLMAAPIVTLLACSQFPAVIGLSYEQAALAAGDSRSYFALAATRAVLQVSLLLGGTISYGVTGAIVGLGLAHLLSHPTLIWLARRHRVWDPLHDVVYFAIAAAVTAMALSLHADFFRALMELR
ncbi:oligosaccharide flippase family protein [Pontibaca methylaminivorans]|uniref:oligosaccharide flippase family protein n=1 Tax=Pontibaca methylaminivorans TaxID=515897 RepID=UPI002FD94E41